MRSLRPAVLATLIMISFGCTGNPKRVLHQDPPATQPAAWRWQREIDVFLAEDQKNPPAQGGVVFTGSSSIRLWKTLKSDFAGLNVMGRGVGGSITLDVIRYADVLVMKHRPKTIVFYCGENDLTAPQTEPEDVLRHFRTFVDLVRRDLPQTKIIFISLKPSPSRIKLIERFRQTNALIHDYIETDPRLTYVDVFTPMLDTTGQPRPELFLKDKLHMTPAGYEIWTSLVKPYLE